MKESCLCTVLFLGLNILDNERRPTYERKKSGAMLKTKFLMNISTEKSIKISYKIQDSFHQTDLSPENMLYLGKLLSIFQFSNLSSRKRRFDVATVSFAYQLVRKWKSKTMENFSETWTLVCHETRLQTESLHGIRNRKIKF